MGKPKTASVATGRSVLSTQRRAVNAQDAPVRHGKRRAGARLSPLKDGLGDSVPHRRRKYSLDTPCRSATECSVNATVPASLCLPSVAASKEPSLVNCSATSEGLSDAVASYRDALRLRPYCLDHQLVCDRLRPCSTTPSAIKKVKLERSDSLLQRVVSAIRVLVARRRVRTSATRASRSSMSSTYQTYR